MRILSNLLGLFLVSRKLGMFGPIIPHMHSGSQSFDFREIRAAKRRNWKASRGSK